MTVVDMSLTFSFASFLWSDRISIPVSESIAVKTSSDQFSLVHIAECVEKKGVEAEHGA